MLLAYLNVLPTDVDCWDALQTKRTHVFASVCVASGTDRSGVDDGLVEVLAVVRTTTANIVDNIWMNL